MERCTGILAASPVFQDPVGDDYSVSGNAVSSSVKGTVSRQLDKYERAKPTPGSCRTVAIDLPFITSSYLGRHMSDVSTKESVVKALASGRQAKFSKYTGALEWKNAVVLWVNIGGKDYTNNFLQGGRLLTWYASQSLHEESPVVRRLLSVGDGEKGRKSGVHSPSRDCVLLFCRLPSLPYICCGRLGLESYFLSKRPMQFLWRLLDFESLHSSVEFVRLLEEK